MTKTEREQLLLLKQETVFMNQKIDKNHWEVMTSIDEIKSILSEIPKTFATKDEHMQNKDSISRLWKIVWAVIGFTFAGLWGAILTILLK